MGITKYELNRRPVNVAADQEFDPNSTNAMSGVAVAQALAALPATLTVASIIGLTSAEAASLKTGDVVCTTDGILYIAVSKNSSYLYLVNVMNGVTTEVKYRSQDNGETWSYHSSRVYNEPLIYSTTDVTTISDIAAGLKVGDIVNVQGSTKNTNFTVMYKDETDGVLGLVYCDPWKIEIVVYTKTNNVWSYSETKKALVKTAIYSVADSTLIQQMADNAIYNAGELSALTISLPSTIESDYISQVDFTSGATPTTLKAPVGILWSGDDLTNGVFVPVASKRYVVMLYSDGVSVRGVVQGFATN